MGLVGEEYGFSMQCPSVLYAWIIYVTPTLTLNNNESRYYRGKMHRLPLLWLIKWSNRILHPLLTTRVS
jgi:hypothetical protein